MNLNRLRIIIDEWYKYIDKEDIADLEQQIEMSLKDFVMQLLQNIHNYYKDRIPYIPTSLDNNSEYIVKSERDFYSLEDFLINRLLRNISEIENREQSILPQSNYDYAFGSILIDKNRIHDHLEIVDQKRKLVAHEILHGLKTQFIDHNIFRSEDYYSLKERLKQRIPNEVNDYGFTHGTGQNGLYSHIGLTIKKGPVNMTYLDEIFNEIDAIRFSCDNYKYLDKLDNGLYLFLRNPESSNTYITNYAFIMERLLDKDTLFAGLYLDPYEIINKINSLYTGIFQKHYNSSKSAIEIIVEQIDIIKKHPDSTMIHITLLEAFYDCLKLHAQLYNISEEEQDSDVVILGNSGLLEVRDGVLSPYSGLSYCDEYDSIRNKRKKQ